MGARVGVPRETASTHPAYPLVFIEIFGAKKFNDFKDLQNTQIPDFANSQNSGFCLFSNITES